MSLMIAERPIGISLEPPSMARAREFLDAVERSRRLHGRWVAPPDSRAALRTYLERNQDGSYIGHFVINDDDELAGVINISEIVRGAFQSGYLGYYAFAPHAGQGLMQHALRQVVASSFRDYGLHRLEANIQPDNYTSRALVGKLGFWLEGYSPRYLKIGGRWRDHERWAMTAEAWRRRGNPGSRYVSPVRLRRVV